MARSSERSLFFIRRQIRIARTVLIVGFLLVAVRAAMLPYFRVHANAVPQHAASVPPATTAGLQPADASLDEPPVVAPAPQWDAEPDGDEPPVAAPPVDPEPTQSPEPHLATTPPRTTRPTPPTPRVADPPKVTPPRPAIEPPPRVVRRPRPVTPRSQPAIRRLPPFEPVEPPVVAPDPDPDDLVPAEAARYVPSPTARQSTAAAQLVISNPLENNGVVRFLLDGQPYGLQPGDARTLAARGSRVILFHRGGRFGDAGYRLPAGRYLFQVTGRGWELFDDRDPADGAP